MEPEVCTGIVLKINGYSDALKIIHLYSKERGYLSMIAPSALFKRKTKTIHSFQTVEIEYLPNERGGLHRLKTADPLTSLPHLYMDIVKMNILLLWGEILHILLKNEGKNESLFHYITRSVDYLNSSEGDTGNFNLCFLYRLSLPLGYRINTDTWQEGYLFCPTDGSFHPTDTSTSCVSGPNTARIIHTLCTCPIESLRNIPLNRAARNVLLDVLLLFYQYHLNLNFNSKALQVIREIFA